METGNNRADGSFAGFFLGGLGGCWRLHKCSELIPGSSL